MPKTIVVFAAGALFASAEGANADVLTVTAKGRIDPVCSISVKTPFPAADLSTARGSVAGSALVDCNTGFVFKATSVNGGLKNDAAVSRGFINSLSYTLYFRLPLATGAIAATCNSPSLAAGNSSCALSPAGLGLSSGGQTAISKIVNMALTWTTPANTHLVAGAYQDTLTISVAAAP